MKKIITLLLLPLLAIVFIACNRDNEEENESPTKLVKTIKVTGGDIVLYTFYYDNQNRPVKITYIANNTYTGIYNLTYGTNTITCTLTEMNKTWLETWILNDNGYTTSSEYSYDNEYENGGSSTSYTYENGCLKSLKRVYYGNLVGDTSEYFYFWNNGNMIRINNSVKFEYSNKENLLNIPFPEALNGTFFKLKGISSKNYLVKKAYEDLLPDGWTYHRTWTYNYIFDTDGYPTKILCGNSEHNYPPTITDTVFLTYY